MKSLTFVLSTALFLASAMICVLPGSASAEYGAMKEDNAVVVPANEDLVTESAQGEEVDNKICPIEGEKIEEGKGHKVTYNGKTYNLCCSMCEAEFLKDPEATIQKLEGMDAAKAETMDAAEGMQMEGETETK